jgi:hypothetical protein
MVRWEYRAIYDSYAEAKQHADAISYCEGNEQRTASVQPLYRHPQPALGDPEIAVEILKLRVTELENAIRRLADQDATLSVQAGNVTVTMDGTLTDAERKAVDSAAHAYADHDDPELEEIAATLRGLLERLSGDEQ